jgi:hypothetical protein
MPHEIHRIAKTVVLVMPPRLRKFTRFLSRRSLSPSGVQNFARDLGKPVPVWTVILLLLTASGAGLVGSVMLSQATQISPQSLPDFTLSSTPVTQNMFQGSLTTLRIDVSSLNGFAGSVNLQASFSPNVWNSSIDLNPSTVSLFTGSGSSRLTITTGGNTTLGRYTLTVTGTSGKILHTVAVPVTIGPAPPPDFGLSASALLLTVSPGSSGFSTMLVNSTGGFSGTVILTATVNPLVSNGPVATVNPGQVTLSPGATQASNLVMSTSGTTPLATYSILIAGGSGSLHHSIVITLTVQ